MSPDRAEFLERCRWVVKTFGHDKVKHVISGAVQDDVVLHYEDDAIEIEASKVSKAIDVSIKKPHHNPVIMVKAGGECIRFHGEWYYAREHVQKIGLLDRMAQEVRDAESGA